MSSSPNPPTNAADRAFLRQTKLRFGDLDELFFARILLRSAENPLEEKLLTVRLDLATLFRLQSLEDIIASTRTLTFAHTDRITETVVEFFNAFGSHEVAQTKETPVLDHYTEQIKTRLTYLKDGDAVGLQPMIESFSQVDQGRFEVTFNTKRLVTVLGDAIGKRLELVGQLTTKAAPFLPQVGERITYKKELDLLIEFLRARQQTTGEEQFSFTTREMPFRHAISVHGEFAMPSPGTCGPAEKVLLPLFLEANGTLDIDYLGLISAPTEPSDLVVKFAIRMPASLSVFGAASHGLRAEERRRLGEIELSIYSRLYEEVKKHYVFLGRPQLEQSFGDLNSWSIRKAAYCLEDPNFLGTRAKEWLRRHADAKNVRIEDNFFLPFVHERLQDSFGDRVIKKSEVYGGEPDLFFDNIPIELKVRIGNSQPLTELIKDTFKPTSQAAAYATKVRIGFVFVLDLPEGQGKTTNLDSCFRVIERVIDGETFRTCLVVVIFHCHHPTPSRIK
jgi:hypothetical protein